MRDPVRPALGAASRLLRGLPVRPPAFAGATLGRTEARIAQRQLDDRGAWEDPRPVEEAERRFASWSGSRSATTFFAARVALTAALRALRLRPGDEVLVPGYTCVVVPNAIRFEGLVPICADIELETFGMDLESARRQCTPRTRAVLLHHLYGLVARDGHAITEWARAKGLAVIEDCAQASGALDRGRPVGAGADVAIHSLEKTKVLTSIVGGVATTGSPELADRLRQAQAGMEVPSAETAERLLRNVLLYEARAHGTPMARRSAERRHAGERWVSTLPDEEVGRKPPSYERRFPAALAPVVLAQLDRVEALNERRRRRARRWDDWARAEDHPVPVITPGSVPVFLRYPLLVDPAMKRDLGWGALLGVSPGVWFTGEFHPVAHPMTECPNARTAVERCVNLPTLW
jgi:dTDP-4-amino-4,6-dideoxygalactose transaminase